MPSTPVTAEITKEEKEKVAFALNLCAASITQIIDSRDLIVLRQERELILGNLNLQNFVKHPALLDTIKQILRAVTYFEIQAGDFSFIEKEYQHRLNNAIWSAIPIPTVLISGGEPVTAAVMIAAHIGIGYINYRRNKSEYLQNREKSEWELRKHEIEQLNGLRSQLFETAWRLSADYDFDDELRLTERQINRYSAAVLEPNPLRRYERLDVMSDNFRAFPPFWYYKGNAAMEALRSGQYSEFSAEYKEKAISAYNEFYNKNFEFLREDVVAASCCLEHISLLEPDDERITELLKRALRFAGDNYDVLQQSILVNLQLGKFKEVIAPLREMIANDYNVGLNGIILSRIYYNESNKTEYEKLCHIAGKDNVLPWGGDGDKNLIDMRRAKLSSEYRDMAQRVVKKLNTSKSSEEASRVYSAFQAVSGLMLKYCGEAKGLSESFKTAEGKLKQVVVSSNEKTLRAFFETAGKVSEEILKTDFSLQITEEASNIIENMRKVAKR